MTALHLQALIFQQLGDRGNPLLRVSIQLLDGGFLEYDLRADQVSFATNRLGQDEVIFALVEA